MFMLGLTSGNLLPLYWGPYPAVRSTLITLAGGLLIGALILAMPTVTSSSLLILMGQWLLYGCLGLWLSASLWWILSFVKTGPGSKGTDPHKGTL